MIVPQYWAEGCASSRTRQKRVTVRRFGWSDVSAEDAQRQADTRAKEALAAALAGQKVVRREPKVPYNGAEGVPIREEIVSRHGATVITRNVYGARCLNTPDVLFADIDLEGEPGFVLGAAVFGVLWAGFAVVDLLLVPRPWAWIGIAGVAIVALALTPLAAAGVRGLFARLAGGPETRARRRLAAFVTANPDWHLRLYRTPAGLRLLAMHRTFDPRENAVTECFKALHCDPMYGSMCRAQSCFRARVSPKPWRIGIRTHIRPRPGVWPVPAERLPERRRWIEEYEIAARRFAACQFVEALGATRAVDPAARAVQALHDQLCQATSDLPTA
jgi:hypothetical protein